MLSMCSLAAAPELLLRALIVIPDMLGFTNALFGPPPPTPPARIDTIDCYWGCYSDSFLPSVFFFLVVMDTVLLPVAMFADTPLGCPCIY